MLTYGTGLLLAKGFFFYISNDVKWSETCLVCSFIIKYQYVIFIWQLPYFYASSGVSALDSFVISCGILYYHVIKMSSNIEMWYVLPFRRPSEAFVFFFK